MYVGSCTVAASVVRPLSYKGHRHYPHERPLACQNRHSAPRRCSPGQDNPELYHSPLLRACRRESTPYTPVWLMRQAGRYMPEYRQIRARVPFLELCKTPDLAAEVTVTAVERLGVDAAIIFADILLILEPMGMQLEFSAGDGPVLHNPIRTLADVERLRDVEPEESLPFVLQAVTTARAQLKPHIPLIGFAGAPFTLASYMIEGGGSRDYVRTKTLMYTQPEAWHALMACLSRNLVRYLNSQIAAGAQVVQLFDSWIGTLSPTDYSTFVLPHSQAVLANLTLAYRRSTLARAPVRFWN